MVRALNKLTALKVERLKAKGRYSDGGGLYLRIMEGNRRYWTFMYERNEKQREIGIGSAARGGMSLAEVRSVAAAYRKALRESRDPLEEKRNTAAAAMASIAVSTFGDFADQYVETMRPSWKNAKHAQQWINTLKTNAAPIRTIRIDRVDTEAVLGVLKPIWTTTPVTAKRLQGRLEAVLDAAKSRGLRSGENPARWRGHLKHLLPRMRRTARHHRSLPYPRMPGFMAALRDRLEPTARLLEFTVLTGARTTEARKATWSEIDMTEETWTVPAERMKAARDHRVPLAPRALEILTAVRSPTPPNDTDFVFSTRKGGCFSENAMIALLKRMGYHTDTTVHGFRASCRTWAEDKTNFPYEVREAALAHKVDDQTQAAYQRGDRFEKRRALMERWAEYCVSGDNVVTFPRQVAV